MAAYNPNLQEATIGRPLAELSGNRNIPTLATVGSAYGRGLARQWLAIQINNLNKYAEQGKGIEAWQIEDLTGLLLAEYYWLNLAELIYFFGRFKIGKYGEFYGAVGPMRIASALRTFVAERKTALDNAGREENNRRLAEEYERHKQEAISYDEWQKIKKQREKQNGHV